MLRSSSSLRSPPSWISTIEAMSARARRRNSTISSSRLRNSGRNRSLTARITAGRAASMSAVSGSSAIAWLPRLLVSTMMVLRKSTVRPCPSVSRPSSSTWSKMLKTSSCAFSTSSNRMTW